MEAVDRASDRVITGALDQRSWGSRELRWAIVGTPGRLEPAALREIKAAAQTLRDPQTSAAEARSLARRYPEILWVASNVHGGEESGTEGSLRVLYELADRRDCAASRILANAIVVLLPIQNPDGREADTRRNFYGFDLNRDWFARTQPETDAKLELLREYPGPLFIDAHEMGGTSFFFPPNSDPVYHEITDESINWINNVYGAAMAEEFDRQGIDYFNRDVYDLFYMGYGDTVPATGFISAGMTYEKGSESPISDRSYEQYLTQWVSLSQAATYKEEILTEWAGAWRQAYSQGERGVLEPNELINPGDLVTEVPDMRVRHYFITERSDAKQDEVEEMIRRLQRMDVDVYRLREGLSVPDFTPYGRPTGREWMPPGTWYVPMAQMQKHWVQAMLHEDTYTPFPYFYDVTAWSQPLLFNVHGGYSGRPLDVNARRVAELEQPQAEAPAEQPRIALFQLSRESTSAIESSGWLRYLLDRVWKVDYADVTAARHRPRRPRPPRRPRGAQRARGRRPRRSRRGRAPGDSPLGQSRRPSGRLAWRHRVRGPARGEHSHARGPDLRCPRHLVPGQGRPRQPAALRGRRRGLRLLRVRQRDDGVGAGAGRGRVPARRLRRLVRLRLRPARRGARRDRRRGR